MKLIKKKALLLAGGMGTRLRPITDKVPKCLVRVGGVPILETWLQKLERAGCDEVIVNTHYLHQKVEDFIRSRNSDSNLKILIAHEDVLLGTAGTLMAHKEILGKEGGYVIHADNAMEEELFGLMEAHNKRLDISVLTMLTFNTKSPNKCGVVKVSADGLVNSFHEKVNNPPSNIANGAVYIIEKELFHIVENELGTPYDISLDILPHLVGRMTAHHTEKFYADIGTAEELERANLFFCNKGW